MKTIKELKATCAVAAILAGTCALAGISATTASATEDATLDTATTTVQVNEMHRLYNPYTGEHFYTANADEQATLVKAGWKAEGIGWYAPTKSNTPVYRLYNPHVKGGDHHYTFDKAERDACIKAGWKDEGIGWYSDDNKSVELYRQYNPNASVGTHNYTSSADEQKTLVKAGWKAENTAWYGVTKTDTTEVMNHSFKPVYKTVHHDAVTQTVDEPVYDIVDISEDRCVEHDKKLLTEEEYQAKNTPEERAKRVAAGGPEEWLSYCSVSPTCFGSCYNKTIGYTKKQVGTKKVTKTTPAYDEQVLEHYACACGATK